MSIDSSLEVKPLDENFFSFFRPTAITISRPRVTNIDSYDFITSDATSTYQRQDASLDLDPNFYYHSTGKMSPMSLKGILQLGILSAAIDKGFDNGSKGLGDNGEDYVSVAISFGGHMTSGRGAFHFKIDRSQLKTSVRGNPVSDMSGERQIYHSVPKEAIIGIRLEKEGFLDIFSESNSLGCASWTHNEEFIRNNIQKYIAFMEEEFNHSMPSEDIEKINANLEIIHNLHSGEGFIIPRIKDDIFAEPEKNIENIIKRSVYKCYQSRIGNDLITPYDIIRYYDATIPVYDSTDNEVRLSNISEFDADYESSSNFSL